MNFFSRIFLGVLTISFSSLCFSQDTSDRQLYSLLSPIKSFSANFSQQLMDEQGTTFQSLSGRLHAQKPNRVHWTVFEPAAQKIVSNGLHLWIYDPDLEQVIIEPYSNNPETNPISLLLGDPQQLNEHFKLVAQPLITDSKQQFILKPNQVNALYTNLMVEFNDRTLSAISFTDNLGQKTHLRFKQFELNPLFTDDFFTFVAPEGVDIVSHVH